MHGHGSCAVTAAGHALPLPPAARGSGGSCTSASTAAGGLSHLSYAAHSPSDNASLATVSMAHGVPYGAATPDGACGALQPLGAAAAEPAPAAEGGGYSAAGDDACELALSSLPSICSDDLLEAIHGTDLEAGGTEAHSTGTGAAGQVGARRPHGVGVGHGLGLGWSHLA